MSNVKKSAEKNNKVVTVRLNKSKYDDLKKFAQSEHLSLSECFRLLLDNREIKNNSISIDSNSRHDLIRSIVHYWNRTNKISNDINRLGNNLNQAVHQLHLKGSTDSKTFVELNQTRDKINETIKLLNKIDEEMTKLWQQLE